MKKFFKSLWSKKLGAFLMFILTEYANRKYGLDLDTQSLAIGTSGYIIGQAIVDIATKPKDSQ